MIIVMVSSLLLCVILISYFQLPDDPVTVKTPNETRVGIKFDSPNVLTETEELAYSDPGFALAYLAHALLFANNFYYASNSEQQRTERSSQSPRPETTVSIGKLIRSLAFWSIAAANGFCASRT